MVDGMTMDDVWEQSDATGVAASTILSAAHKTVGRDAEF